MHSGSKVILKSNLCSYLEDLLSKAWYFDWLANWLCFEVCPDSLLSKIQNRAKCGPVSRSIILVDDFANLWIICFWYETNKKNLNWFRSLQMYLLELLFLHISYLLLIWKPPWRKTNLYMFLFIFVFAQFSLHELILSRAHSRNHMFKRQKQMFTGRNLTLIFLSPLCPGWPHFFSGHVGNFPHISPRDRIDRWAPHKPSWVSSNI